MSAITHTTGPQAVESVDVSTPTGPGALQGRGLAVSKATAAMVALLVLAVATDRLGLRVGGFNVRLEFVAGVLVVALALLKQGTTALRLVGTVDLLLAGWFAANLLSSLLFSPDTGESLKNVAILGGLMSIYVATRLTVRSAEGAVWASGLFVVAGAGMSAVGIGSALLFHVVGPNFGIVLERFYRDGIFVLTPKVQSLLWEPNIYGSFSLAVCALASAFVMAQRKSPDKSPAGGRSNAVGLHLSPAILHTAIALGMCGVMLSMTRTVWLVGPALVLAMAAVAWKLGLATLRNIAIGMLLPSLIGGVVGLGLGLTLPSYRWQMGSPWELTQEQIDGMVRQRLFNAETPAPTPVPGTTTPGATQTPVPAGEGSAAGDRLSEALDKPGETTSLTGRWSVFSDAFRGWLERPLLGWGTAAFPLVYPPPPGGGYWIANIMLHTLFDTGIIGLFLLGAAGVWAALRALKALRKAPALWNTQAFLTYGLLSACAGLFIAYQVTDGSWLGFTWLLFALLVASGDRRGVESAPLRATADSELRT